MDGLTEALHNLSNIIIQKDGHYLCSQIYIPSQYFMQIKQLQAIALQCRDLLKNIQHFHLTRDQQEIPATKRTIKERKIEIQQIRAQIKKLHAQSKHRKELNKYMRAAEEQIKNMKNLNSKESAHYRQLQRLCQRSRMNLLDQKTKASKLKQQGQVLKELQGFVEEGIRFERQYQSLKQKYDQITKLLINQKNNFDNIFNSKKEWIKEMSKNNDEIDVKIQFLSKEIGLQEQIINQINQLELQQQRNSLQLTQKKNEQEDRSFKILQKQAQVLFQKRTNLSVWQKHEVTNLLQKKQLQNQRQVRRIGSIFRQRYTQHLTQQKHKQNKDLRLSADLLKLSNKQSDHKYISNAPFHFVSKERLTQLQKSKRIRTRHTTEPLENLSEIRRTKLRTVFQDEGQSEPQRESIVNIYERLKRDKLNSSSVLKFKRRQNKRKSHQRDRGVPFERQHFVFD